MELCELVNRVSSQLILAFHYQVEGLWENCKLFCFMIHSKTYWNDYKIMSLLCIKPHRSVMQSDHQHDLWVNREVTKAHWHQNEVWEQCDNTVSGDGAIYIQCDRVVRQSGMRVGLYILFRKCCKNDHFQFTWMLLRKNDPFSSPYMLILLGAE